MGRSNVAELKVVNWMCDGDSIVIDRGTEKILLNKSAKIVWELIDGINTIQDIIDELVKKYGDQNDEDYLISIVEETMSMLENEQLIIMKAASDFDGWLQYE
ncbi:PqqD family peptide modification chaperone [Clostridium thermarum]|uniref:PqqD family peptide modification chaperone n=1 Tax=Clostridium thermarum TaxID=1716543 RepID=UPI0013D11DA9|nr:PqqD family peptide modification chaperone [Clostridium thermarum]